MQKVYFRLTCVAQNARLLIKLPKGRTIRNVMGGGGRGIFEPQEFFFSLSNFLYEFFLGQSMNIFLELIGVHEFFFI